MNTGRDRTIRAPLDRELRRYIQESCPLLNSVIERHGRDQHLRNGVPIIHRFWAVINTEPPAVHSRPERQAGNFADYLMHAGFEAEIVNAIPPNHLPRVVEQVNTMGD